MIKTYEKCKNFRKGNVTCELCIINKEYINLQLANCKSCFEALI